MAYWHTVISCHVLHYFVLLLLYKPHAVAIIAVSAVRLAVGEDGSAGIRWSQRRTGKFTLV